MKTILILSLFISSAAFASDLFIKDEFFSGKLLMVSQPAPANAFKCLERKCWLREGHWEFSTDKELLTTTTDAALEIYNSLKVEEKVLHSDGRETILFKSFQVGSVAHEFSFLGCLKNLEKDQLRSVSCTFFSDLGVSAEP